MIQSLISSTLERGTDEWRIARIKEICADYWVYVEKNQKIKNKDGGLVPFVPNSVQRKLATLVLTRLAEGIPVRIIILKARQMGISTEVESLTSWYVETHRNISAIIIAHLDEAAKNLYEMFRTFYDHAEAPFQPSLKYNTKSDLTFDKLGSKITTGSAESKEVGRSGTNQIVHNSEVAFWKNGKELVAGLLQTVPYRPNTMVFHESTANGIGGYFYETWQAAKRGDSVFEFLFFAWFEMEEYRLPVPAMGIHLSDAENELKSLYDIDDMQIMWYRMKLKEFGNDTDRMKQEYPSNDMEAFIASGRPRFNIKSLLAYELQATPGEQLELFIVESEYKTAVVDSSPFHVWKYPDRLGQYVIGIDVAEGLEHGDYSVIDVTDKKTMETVARWRGHCDPDRLGDIAYDIGIWYMRALIGTEVNNHGLTTLQRLKDRNYPNLYVRDKSYEKEYFDIPASQLGWKTDLRTKPLMIDYLAQAIRERSMKDYDITFIRECMTYVVDDNGRTNAQEGCFDDCVIAKAIALQMFVWSFTAPETQDVYFDPNYLPS